MGKIGPKFSHLLTVRAEGAAPPLMVSLTVKIPFFFTTPLSIKRCSFRWSEDRDSGVDDYYANGDVERFADHCHTKQYKVHEGFIPTPSSQWTYLGRIHSHFWSTLYFRIACLDVFSPPSDISIVWPTPSVKDGALLRWRNPTIVPEFSTKPLHSPVISLLNNVQYVTG